MNVSGTGDFFIVLNAPLTAKVDISKLKVNGGLSFDASDSYLSVNKDGKLVITGKCVGKGNARIPYTVYGKKYTIKVKAQ
jgi:hypothetical protein